LSATDGLAGTYSLSGQTSGVSAFLGLKDSYDANNAYLTVIQTQPLDSVAETPNQQAVAEAVENLPPDNAVQDAVLNVPDAPSARAAFDQLSGQVQASAQGALLANSLYVRDVAFDRLRDVICTAETVRQKTSCDSKKLSVWGQGFGGWGGIGGNGNAAGLNHSTAGFLIGLDAPMTDWRLGFFGGYSRSDFHVVSGGAAGRSDDFHLGIYGGGLLDGIALRLGASYSWSGVNTDRQVGIESFSDRLHGGYNGGTLQGFGEVGYGLDWRGLSLEPFANLTYASLHSDGFAEAGGPAALSVKPNSIAQTITTLGLRPSLDVTLYGLDATLRGMAGWRHSFGTVTPAALVSFADGSPFQVSGASLARDAAALEAGLDVTLEDGTTLGLTYGGQFSGQTTDQTLRGTIRVSF
jgi:outer membrane autotransporter protein